MLPSEVKRQSYRGYRYNVLDGWSKLEEATINAETYKVEFFRLSERTIDPMCDALNGYYSTWTKFLCEYTDKKGKLAVVIDTPEDADKVYTMLADIEPLEFEHEDPMSAVDVARTKLKAVIDLIRNSEEEKYAV